MNDTITGQFFGKSGPLFRLHMKTAALTLLTLGIYRFWAKTRIRKYVWSAVSGDGDGFEYTGTGLEKFLGFLLAVVVLAVYLGLLQLVLTFLGLSLLSEAETGAQVGLQVAVSNLSLLAVLPLLFFAQYRARRYRMARTRWRGMRFGMENAAGGYVWRALGHLALTVLSLGLLLPRQSFYLEKYMADRTWFGDGRFAQGGRWQGLYPGLRHVFIGLAIFGVSLIVGPALNMPGLSGIGVLAGLAWLAIGFVYYRVYALNYMASHKVFDGKVRIEARARLGQVLRIIVVGGLLVTLAGALGAALVGALSLLSAGGPEAMLGGMGEPGSFDPSRLVGPALVTGLGYVVLLLVLSGLSLVLITAKVLEHVVTHVTITNASHLDAVRQRAGDKGADAEGFADALDVGGAF